MSHQETKESNNGSWMDYFNHTFSAPEYSYSVSHDQYIGNEQVRHRDEEY